VKCFVDGNLPPRLCSWLASRGHEAEHLFDRNLLRATDSEIWDVAKSENRVIFSKDVDFYDRALLFGSPPQVVHIAVGNCSNDRLFEILDANWRGVEAALTAGARLISISQERIEVFA
jgi:predicted nuclease of predicted toxin-antitoxin system